jgi:fatty-acyl-CoA synthase
MSGSLDYRHVAGHKRGITLLDSRGPLAESGYADLFDQARTAAAAYLRHGALAGDRVVLSMRTDTDYLVALVGALLAGIVPCTVAPPPTPSRTDSGGVRHLAAAVRAVRPTAVIATDAADLRGVLDVPVLGVDDLRHDVALPVDRLHRPHPEQPHHIQLTSGSTSAPKAVVLPHRAVAANLDVLIAASELDPDSDTISSWLPLHHDMGLVQLLAGLTTGAPVDLMAPYSFLRDPLSWPRHIGARGGTITAAPPFGYRAAARRLRERPEDLDLSGLRRAYVGAEPIPADVLRDFTASFAHTGLREDVIVPCYGMAETVLATTLALNPGSEFGRVSTLVLDRGALHLHGKAVPASDPADSITLVNCGRPVPGVEVTVRGDDGDLCPEDTVGEIHVGGTSLMSGYLGDNGHAEPIGGEHATGDLGVIVNGGLYIVGRLKEMLIVNGRNLPPYDIEAAIEPHPAIGAGNSAVFSHLAPDGVEHVVAVAESRATGAERAALIDDIATAVRQAFGFTPSDIVVVSRGRIPRTTSGKRQRDLLRTHYLRDRVA